MDQIDVEHARHRHEQEHAAQFTTSAPGHWSTGQGRGGTVPPDAATGEAGTPTTPTRRGLWASLALLGLAALTVTVPQVAQVSLFASMGLLFGGGFAVAVAAARATLPPEGDGAKRPGWWL